MGSCMSKQLERDPFTPYDNTSTPNPSYPAPERPPRRPVVPGDLNFTTSVNGRNHWSASEVYRIDRLLGQGGFGSVYSGAHKFHKESGRSVVVAIKKTKPTRVDFAELDRNFTYDEMDECCQEIVTLNRLRGQSADATPVLYMYEYFLEGSAFSMVTELLGQELDHFDIRGRGFTLEHAKQIAKTILKGMKYMHEKNVVHRDLKMQNILFVRDGDFSRLKIVDFGLAKVLRNGQQAGEFCGSHGYIAPEIYKRQRYSYEVDLFSFGVILFRLLSGSRPFPNKNKDVLKQRTINLQWEMNINDWQNVPDEAQDLVRKLLIGERQRLKVDQALAHRWFREQSNNTMTSVLRPEFSMVQPDSQYSKKINPQSNVSSSAHTTTNGFWIESSLIQPFELLKEAEIYHGYLIPDERSDERMLVTEEEKAGTFSIPSYIARLPRFTELECRKICWQLAKMVQTLHECGLSHRDLHPGNVRIDQFGQISVTGMRFAQSTRKLLTGHFGYLYSYYAFKAPEVDTRLAHDKSVDLWSLGALFYFLSTGLAPFRAEKMELIFAKQNGQLSFDIVQVSPSLRRLITGLLRVEPTERYTIEQVLFDDWMEQPKERLERTDLSAAQVFHSDYENTVPNTS